MQLKALAAKQQGPVATSSGAQPWSNGCLPLAARSGGLNHTNWEYCLCKRHTPASGGPPERQGQRREPAAGDVEFISERIGGSRSLHRLGGDSLL